MAQTKSAAQQADDFRLAIRFAIEGRNLRVITLRLLGLIAVLVSLAAKLYLLNGRSP